MPTMFISCVVRGLNGSYFALDDAGHTPFGVHGVFMMSDRVRIAYDEPVTRLSSIQVTPDETYVRNGIHVGASGALGHVDVFFAKNGVPLAPVNAQLAGSNIWVTGWKHS